MTAAHAHPNPSWLGFVASGRARSHIRNFLKGMHRGEAVELGSRMLRQSLHALSGKHFIVPEPVWQEYLREHTEHNNDFEDVLADIGTGKLLPVVVASRLLELAGETSGEPLRVGPIAIRGNEGASLQFSPCCNPIPGDRIVGVVNKGQGLLIHRHDCTNIQKFDPEKLLDMEWELAQPKLFGVPVSVLAKSERGALAAVAAAITESSANIESVDMQDAHSGEGYVQIRFRLQVEGLAHLGEVIANIQRQAAVVRAARL